MKPPLVIYHADCVDGFTAAWAAWLVLGDAAEYRPFHYGDLPTADELRGRHLYILDFSFPNEVMRDITSVADQVVLLDHHKSAVENLQTFFPPGHVIVRLDMNRSGAGLAWDEIADPFLNRRRPPLINYVEDRDLWRHQLPETKAISALIASRPRTFQSWTILSEQLEQSFAMCCGWGSAALDVTTRYVQELKDRHCWTWLAGCRVPCINTTFGTSDLLHELAAGHPFAVGWFQRQDGQFQYSLRASQVSAYDVADIAREFGGGGHAKAAGFTLNEPLETIGR